MKRAISALSKIYHIHEKYAADYIKKSDELGISSRCLNCALQHMKIAYCYRCLAQSLSCDRTRGHRVRILYVQEKIKDLTDRIEGQTKTDKQVLGQAFSEFLGHPKPLVIVAPSRKLRLRPNG